MLNFCFVHVESQEHVINPNLQIYMVAALAGLHKWVLAPLRKQKRKSGISRNLNITQWLTAWEEVNENLSEWHEKKENREKSLQSAAVGWWEIVIIIIKAIFVTCVFFLFVLFFSGEFTSTLRHNGLLPSRFFNHSFAAAKLCRRKLLDARALVQWHFFR